MQPILRMQSAKTANAWQKPVHSCAAVTRSGCASIRSSLRIVWADGADDVVFWRVTNNFSEPYLPTSLITRAAARIRKETGRKRVAFSAAPAPEYFDRAIDSERIAQFNVRVVRALTALGIEPERAEEVFSYVGMGSEWRGAMWSAASLAESVPARAQWQSDLIQRIATVCRFMPMSMAIDGLFPWVLAIGSRVLEEAVTEFNGA